MATVEFSLPELGENVAGGDVLRVLVKPGDSIERDQPVLELETDKATIEVPSAVSGTVRDVKVKAGDKLQVGQLVLVVDAGEPSSRKATPTPAAVSEVAAAQPSAATPRAASRGAAPPAAARVPAPPAPPPAQVSSSPVEFALPELGENVTGGDVLRVLVKVGDRLAIDQPVVELETDKATIEVPSSVSGIVSEIRVKEGEKVAVGQVVLVVEGDGAPSAAAVPSAPAQARAPSSDDWAASVEEEGAGFAEPVGYDTASGGLEQHVAGRVRRRGPDKPGMHEDALAEAEADTAPRRAEVVSITRASRGAAAVPAPAAPSVRRVARELGVPIDQVPGSGPGGRISADDVKAYVKRIMLAGGPKSPAQPAGRPAPAPLPDFSTWGEIERRPMRAVRRKTAQHLSQAWAQIPHVTQFDKADISGLEELRKRYASQAEAAGGKLTMTAIALKAVAAALKIFPQFNASIDMAAEEIIYKRYVHIGVAVDTERGLLVPVIRDVDRKGITQLAVELAQVSEKARSGKTPLEDMQGACFTITNLGGIGGTAFTPIVNHPEVAILGLSRSIMEPVYVDGEFRPRLMLPLSLSYDHRVIDGADGIRFLRWICEALEQPFLLSLQG